MKMHLIMLLIGSVFLVQVAGAFVISVEPAHLEMGDQVIITVEGLSNGTTFSLEIEGVFEVSPGGEFSFETRELSLPFTLGNGSISATLQNTQENMLAVRKGDTEVRKVGVSQNGIFSASETGTIPAGIYDYIILGGTAAPDANRVTATVTLSGVKTGPDDAVITFYADGITDGTVSIRAHTNGILVLERTLIIGNPEATVTTTATTQPIYGGGGGSSSGGGSVTTASTTSVTTSPTGSPPATTETTATTPAGSAAATMIETSAGQVEETGAVPADTTARAGSSLILAVAAIVPGFMLFARRRR